jgi:hypothetical protein
MVLECAMPFNLKESTMPKTTVYYFEKYDIPTHIMTRSSRPATIQAIAKAQGKTLKKTAQEVDASRIDAEGYLLAS